MYKNGLLASNQLCPFLPILATPTLVLILLWSGALFCAWLQRVFYTKLAIYKKGLLASNQFCPFCPIWQGYLRNLVLTFCS
jgi:hypothetical protein